MKKYLCIAGSAVGGGMIGFFANKLQDGMGAVCFAAGVMMLVFSIAAMGKDKE